MVGLVNGFGCVLAMMLAAPTLAARLGEQMVRAFAALLAEEASAPGRPDTLAGRLTTTLSPGLPATEQRDLVCGLIQFMG